MNTSLMILAFILGAVGAVMIVVAAIFGVTQKHRTSAWVKWVRWGGVALMALTLAFMLIMTFAITPAALKAL